MGGMVAKHVLFDSNCGEFRARLVLSSKIITKFP
jgi:hypothetical protein